MGVHTLHAVSAPHVDTRVPAWAQLPTVALLQVDPPVPMEAVAAGCSLLWWPQQLAAADKLWDVAAAASAAVRRERDAKGGLAFWKRLHAEKTMAEVATLPEPPFLPPFTVRCSLALALMLFPRRLNRRLRSRPLCCPSWCIPRTC